MVKKKIYIVLLKMSTCNCGKNKPSIPKPSEKTGDYSPLSTAYNTLQGSVNKTKNICMLEYVLLILAVFIIFKLVKGYKRG
jgi:hypothetical protein